MTQLATELLATALQLPDEDRADVTEQLLASFDPQPGEADPLDDAEILVELDRRAEELRDNPASAWEIVKEMR